MVRALPFVLILVFEIFCVIDIIQTPTDQARGLPKFGWLVLALLFPLVGGIAWLVAGRPKSVGGGRSAYERPATGFPEYDRPGRAPGLTPESDEEFLRKVRERAEEQRRRYAEQQRAEQQKAAEQAEGPEDPDATH